MGDESLAALSRRYLDHLTVCGYAPATLSGMRGALERFARWCAGRGVTQVGEVVTELVEQYGSELAIRPGPSGRMLGVSSRRWLLGSVRGLFAWLVDQQLAAADPTAGLDLPRRGARLPRGVLSVAQVDQLFACIDLAARNGVRDRAIVEVLYAAGLRRAELAALRLDDVDLARALVWVRCGKGGKDRVVPLGVRASAWIARYCEGARVFDVRGEDDGIVFRTRRGRGFAPAGLSELVRGLLVRAGLAVEGACHVLRHSMATHMLAGGADLRAIQQMLGHAELATTALYARVSVEDLRAVHGRTHPASRGCSWATRGGGL